MVTASADRVTQAHRVEQEWFNRCVQNPTPDNIVDWHNALHAYAQTIAEDYGWQDPGSIVAMVGLLKMRTVDLLRSH